MTTLSERAAPGDRPGVEHFECGVCGASSWVPLRVQSSAFATRSRFPDIHEFENFVCARCAVVATIPQIDQDSVARFYNSGYRRSEFSIDLGDREIEPPVQMPWSGVSFQRFRTFYDMVQRVRKTDAAVLPTPADSFIDVGAYQGMFLSAVQQAWGAEGVAYDFSESGIAFARRALGLERSFVARDLMTDVFPLRARFVSLVHVFEHLPQPAGFLRRIRDEMLASDGGYLYLEVPNVKAHPLDDPTHVYMYNEATLRSLLAAEGFEVRDLVFTGYPEAPFEKSYGSPGQNMACLAWTRGRTEGVADWSSVPSALALQSAIRDSWSSVARKVLRLRLSMLLRDLRSLLGRTLRYLQRDVRMGRDG